jgi:hypothetical protein
VGALGHYIEREGVPTAQISLIREQTAAIKPSRALWVPFMLGRPFGAPGAPEFQRKVLCALLALFERPSGPVLEDFPEEAPGTETSSEGLACPVSFAVASSTNGGLVSAMRNEIAQLGPWYDLARRRRGRTTVGIFGRTVDEAARHVASYVEGRPEPAPSGWTPGMAVKRATDDLKAYYYEAVGAQPGNLSPSAIEQWFWSETAAAKAFLAIRDLCLQSDDESLKPLGKSSLVPRFVTDAEQKARAKSDRRS